MIDLNSHEIGSALVGVVYVDRYNDELTGTVSLDPWRSYRSEQA